MPRAIRPRTPYLGQLEFDSRLPISSRVQRAGARRASRVTQVHTGDEPLFLTTGEGKIHAQRGVADKPDAVLGGAPNLVICVLSGRLELASAVKAGLRFQGSRAALARVGSTSVNGAKRPPVARTPGTART